MGGLACQALGVRGDRGPAVVADRGEHRGVGVDPPRVLAVGGQVRDELRRGDRGVLDRGGPLLLGQGGEGGHVQGPGAGDLLRAAGRPGGGQRGQGAGHVAARDERDAAVRRGEPELAAGPGPGQEAQEELGVDGGPGERERAAAFGEQLLGVAVADRVAERRVQDGVQAAQRHDVGDPAAGGGPDQVAVVHDHVRHRAVAGDQDQGGHPVQRGGQGRLVGVAGLARLGSGRSRRGAGRAAGQRHDLVLLRGQQAHDLAADPAAGPGYRDPHRAVLPSRRACRPGGSGPGSGRSDA